jgi:hypothetical protein
MRNRHPAGQRDPYLARTGSALARSPSERLEPTRPPTPRRRSHGARRARRARPLLRLVNGLLTFTLVVLILTVAAD